MHKSEKMLKLNIEARLTAIQQQYHPYSKKVLRTRTFWGNKNLSDPELFTEDDKETLLNRWICSKGNKEILSDPVVGTEGKEETLNDLTFALRVLNF